MGEMPVTWGGPVWTVAPLKDTSCITHGPAELNDVEAEYEPAKATTASCAMSPSGDVIILFTNGDPAEELAVETILAANRSSLAVVVTNDPLLEVLLFPEPAAATSCGLTVSMPLYSRILMSG